MNQLQYHKYIETCIACATACNHCAVACLEEEDVQQLTKCIRLDLECAIICRTTAELLSVASVYSQQICKICADICNACADECEKHAAKGLEHCKECAEACRLCAKEIMDFYKNLDKDTKTANVQQDEIAILSRVSAELMSLGSAYSKQICELTSTACDASAEAVEKFQKMEIKHSIDRAFMVTEAKKHFENQNLEENPNEAKKINDQPDQKKEVIEMKKKHSSALLTASLWRSPVNHARRHSRGGLFGSYANMGTNVSYEEEDI